MALAGGCAIVALSIVGARRMAQALRRAWVAFAVAQVLFLTADVARTVLRYTWDDVSFPTVADAFYLTQYVALAFGLVWLVRGRRDGRDRAAFLDAAILTTGVSVVGIIFFVAPAATAASSMILGQVVAAAYPAVDLHYVVSIGGRRRTRRGPAASICCPTSCSASRSSTRRPGRSPSPRPTGSRPSTRRGWAGWASRWCWHRSPTRSRT